jgi:hypothetical protein
MMSPYHDLARCYEPENDNHEQLAEDIATLVILGLEVAESDTPRQTLLEKLGER